MLAAPRGVDFRRHASGGMARAQSQGLIYLSAGLAILQDERPFPLPQPHV